jgi:hypothetical protein
VSSLLLSCGLGLREPRLTEAVSVPLQHIKEVTDQVRDRLAIAEREVKSNEENAVQAG